MGSDNVKIKGRERREEGEGGEGRGGEAFTENKRRKSKRDFFAGPSIESVYCVFVLIFFFVIFLPLKSMSIRNRKSQRP